MVELAEAAGCPVPPVTIDQARIRPNDPRRVEGANEAIRRALGWVPSIPLRTTIRDVLAERHPNLVGAGARTRG